MSYHIRKKKTQFTFACIRVRVRVLTNIDGLRMNEYYYDVVNAEDKY